MSATIPAAKQGTRKLKRRLVKIALSAIGLGIASSVLATTPANAVTWKGCNWFGYCTVKFSRAETSAIAAGATTLVGFYVLS
jgi:hypothetical protein